jgi:hypothetical protein
VQASSTLTSLAQGARRNRLSLVYVILTDILQMTKGTADACREATLELALAQKGCVLFFPYWKPGRCLIQADSPGGISKSSAFRSSG